MAYRYKKPYRVKRKKPIFYKRSFWIALLALLTAGSFVYFLFFSQFFQIKEVRISGTKDVSQAELRSFFSPENIFLTDTGKIKESILKNFPKIADIEIRRKLPASLTVEVREKTALALWCGEEECFLLDGTGTPFEAAGAEETDLLRVFGEKDLLGEGAVGQILEIHEKLEDDLGLETEKMILVSSRRLDVKTVEGWEIYFNREKDLSWQLVQLQLLLQRQISSEEREGLQYVDLRFEKAYYK